MSKLNTHVNVDGSWYGPDNDVPAEVAKRITNPKVWADSERTGEPARAATFTMVGEEPPRGGPGSSADAWRAFATSNKVDVPEGASAKEIASAWDQHKAEQGG